MPAYSFATTATADDELGIWQPLPAATARDFALESAGLDAPLAAEEVNWWAVSLPEDAKAATQVLTLADARLAVAQAALPYASQRLATFSALGGAPVPPVRGDEAPEEALAGWIGMSQSGRALPEELDRLAQVAGFFTRLRDSMRNYAAIDTQVGGVRTGLTLVSWTGDFRTAWPRGLTADEAARHRAAVSLSLRTRDAWLRLGLTVAQGTLRIATLFGVNPTLALPAAYRFVRQVIDQVQALGGLPALANV